MDSRNIRFARRMGEHFPCPEYANPIEKHEGPGVLMSAWFWIGGAMSVAAWTLIWWAVASLLQYIRN